MQLNAFLITPNRHIDRVAKAALILTIFFVPVSQAAAYVFMALTMLAWLAAGGYGQRFHALKHNYFAWSTLGLFLLICVGTLYSSGDTEEIGRHVRKYGKLVFIVLAITLLQEATWRKRSLNAFALAMFITLLLSMLSLVMPIPFIKGDSGAVTGNHFVFKDHIAQNLMMSVFVLVMLIKCRYADGTVRKLVYLAIAICAVINILFFVHGRTGYVSLAAVMVVFIILGMPPRVRWPALFVVLVAGIGTFFLSSNLKHRVELAIQEIQTHEPSKVTSAGARIEMTRISIQLIKERPLFGWGTGSYQEQFCQRAVTQALCAVGGYHPHNQFLSFGVQLGAIGILAYLLFLGTAAQRIINFPTPEKVFGAGLLAALIVDSMLHAPFFLVGEAQFFMAMLAVALAGGYAPDYLAQRAPAKPVAA